MKSTSTNISTLTNPFRLTTIIVVVVPVAMPLESLRGWGRTYSFMAEEFVVDISNRNAIFSLLQS
jgi:hypothetical protein